MLNNSPNFGFPAYYGQYLPLPGYQGLHPLSYQSSYFPSYLWVEPNFNHQTCQVLLTYGDQQFFNTEVYQQQAKDQSHFQMQEIQNSHRLQSQKDLLHFSPTQGRYDIQQQKWAVKPSGAFTYCSISQENQRPSPQSIESDLAMPIKADNANNNEIQVEDKKLIQNLRYQRKNIEANIVNKVYTHLKTILKFGQKSVEKLLNDREKSIIYFKVVEKLEKAKKQLIKRQFLKSLTSIDESLPGYNKVLKQLQKKGQSIQQFEYYIRVIIRNFLRNEARNSILTSRKMNPSLWIDHLRKVRELQEYLFAQDDEEELN